MYIYNASLSDCFVPKESVLNDISVLVLIEEWKANSHAYLIR